jgi:putative membrane protein
MAELKGDAFDKSFARDMVADHKKDIAAYKKEAKQDDAAGHYAKDSPPTLQEHLDTAESLVKER